MDNPRSTLLLYTGGSEETFYQLVQKAFPSEPGDCGMPIVHQDGRIEYPTGDPPDIDGYERITARSFKPVWPSCRWRSLTVTTPDGHITIKSRCQYPLAPCYLKQVLPTECDECQERQPIPQIK